MSVGLRPYAVAVAVVAGATVLALALRGAVLGAVGPAVLAAVVIACWYGGRHCSPAPSHSSCPKPW